MTSKLASRTQWTHQKSSRDGAKIDRFIVHHAATTGLETILSLFAGAREVSANYALGNDGTLVAAVPEKERGWTSGSYEWDRRAITIEVANSHAGEPWPVSDKAFDKLARLIADVADRYGFPVDDTHVLTHQELYTRYGASYPTACPGDLQRRKGELLKLARKYQGKSPAKPKPSKPAAKPSKPKPAKPASKPKAPKFPLSRGQYFGPEGRGNESVSGWHSHRDDLRRWQQRMKDRGWEIQVDGLYGPQGATSPTGNTAAIAEAFQREKGLEVDSLIGPETWAAAWTEPVT